MAKVRKKQWEEVELAPKTVQGNECCHAIHFLIEMSAEELTGRGHDRALRSASGTHFLQPGRLLPVVWLLRLHPAEPWGRGPWRRPHRHASQVGSTNPTLLFNIARLTRSPQGIFKCGPVLPHPLFSFCRANILLFTKQNVQGFHLLFLQFLF